jgi:hypothetical protein
VAFEVPGTVSVNRSDTTLQAPVESALVPAIYSFELKLPDRTAKATLTVKPGLGSDFLFPSSKLPQNSTMANPVLRSQHHQLSP